MSEVIEIPAELTYFQLPNAVQERLQFLLDRQDTGEQLNQTERQEAEGLVELAEFLSLIRLRYAFGVKLRLSRKRAGGISQRVIKQQ
jgi:hypothetical protein